MARQLYRIYLYLVSIALLVLAVFGIAILLNTLLAYTSLRGTYRAAPGQRELVQSIVFAVTAWVIAAALGALHLRLIRRDIAEFPLAGSGGIRAFFLNAAQAIGTLVVVIAGAGSFATLAHSLPGSAGDSAASFATAIAALLFVLALEWERRRYRTAPGAATIFQRLHLFGIPLILVLITTFGYWNDAMRTSIEDVLIGAKLYNPLDPGACGPDNFNTINGPCSLPNAAFLWLAALVPIAVIALYSFMARNDFQSLIRMLTHIGSLSVGVGALLVGLVRGVELLLRGMFGLPVSWSDVAHPWYAAYDFLSPLSIGILLVVAYGLWLRAERGRLPTGSQTTTLIAEAVVALIFAVAFWWGMGRVIYTALQWVGASPGESFAAQWATAIALAIGGLAYIPLAIHLRLATARTGIGAPRRGFVLALLAGGTVTGAVGLTITLYTFGTNLLGAPLNDWERTVRGGLAALAVGIVLVAVYGWIAAQERSVAALFRRLKEATSVPKAPALPTQPPEVGAKAETDLTTAIEQALKEYEAHTISLAEATSRIKSLMDQSAQNAPAERAGV